MNYLERSEINIIKKALSESAQSRSTFFRLRGGSGSGKTELIKKAVDSAVRAENVYIYMDITEDEYHSSEFFSCLLSSIYFPCPHRYNSITSVPSPYSFSDFIKKSEKKRFFANGFRTIGSVAASSIPYIGGSISAIFDKAYDERIFPSEDFLTLYLDYVKNRARVNFIVDNYQFLDENMKRIFETGINRYINGVTCLVIERTKGDLEWAPSYCSAFHEDSLDINYIERKDFDHLIEIQDIKISEEQREVMWTISRGNLKDIDIMLNELRITPNKNLMKSSVAFKNLDATQQSILLVISILSAGLKEDIMVIIIRQLLSETDEEIIKSAIELLVNIGFIYINSSTNDTIKPSHETVTNHVKEAIDTQDFAIFVSRLSECLEEIVVSYHGKSEYAYLVHCWMGISSAETLKHNISYVQDLINIKYKENAYHYIDIIAANVRGIIKYLPDSTVEKVLDSLQRVSDFSRGKNILNDIRTENEELYNKFKIYDAKFLIQTYEFNDALDLLDELKDSSIKLLCQTNALQHLGHDSKVRSLLDSKLGLIERDENYYIILRNTAHCYDFAQAIKNLEESLEYFTSQNNRIFAEATVRNNLSVVYAWSKLYEKALKYSNEAISILDSLGSNEIFEAYCNKSIIMLQMGDYNSAIENAELALQNCPASLSLDRILLDINLHLIELYADKISSATALDSIYKLREQYRIIDDPWYEFQMLHSILMLERLAGNTDSKQLDTKHMRYIENYNDGMTKYYILKDYNSGEKDIKFCFGLSPNWRY